VVINTCFGGFGLSHKGVMRYAEIAGIKLYPWNDHITRKYHGDNPCGYTHYALVPIESLERNQNGDPIVSDENYWYYGNLRRTDTILVQVVEELGPDSWSEHAELKVVEVPDEVQWHITDYDGVETIHEIHRSWS